MNEEVQFGASTQKNKSKALVEGSDLS